MLQRLEKESILHKSYSIVFHYEIAFMAGEEALWQNSVWIAGVCYTIFISHSLSCHNTALHSCSHHSTSNFHSPLFPLQKTNIKHIHDNSLSHSVVFWPIELAFECVLECVILAADSGATTHYSNTAHTNTHTPHIHNNNNNSSDDRRELATKNACNSKHRRNAMN